MLQKFWNVQERRQRLLKENDDNARLRGPTPEEMRHYYGDCPHAGRGFTRDGPEVAVCGAFHVGGVSCWRLLVRDLNCPREARR